MFPASTKQSGVTLAFPDVCSIPQPPSPYVPIPYPNIAAALPGTSKVPVGGNTVMVKSSGLATTTGNEPGTLKGIVGTSTTGGSSYVRVGAPAMTAFTLGIGGPTPAQQAVATQLRAILANVHSQILAMPGSDPN